MSARPVDLGLLIARADLRWCSENTAEHLPREHVQALVAAVEHHVVDRATVDALRAELGNARALLGRLVTAVTGYWEPDGDVPTQVRAALADLRKVEQFLLSQHNVVKHPACGRDTADAGGLGESAKNQGVA